MKSAESEFDARTMRTREEKNNIEGTTSNDNDKFM